MSGYWPFLDQCAAVNRSFLAKLTVNFGSNGLCSISVNSIFKMIIRINEWRINESCHFGWSDFIDFRAIWCYFRWSFTHHFPGIWLSDIILILWKGTGNKGLFDQNKKIHIYTSMGNLMCILKISIMGFENLFCPLSNPRQTASVDCQIWRGKPHYPYLLCSLDLYALLCQQFVLTHSTESLTVSGAFFFSLWRRNAHALR